MCFNCNIQKYVYYIRASPVSTDKKKQGIFGKISWYELHMFPRLTSFLSEFQYLIQIKAFQMGIYKCSEY